MEIRRVPAAERAATIGPLATYAFLPSPEPAKEPAKEPDPRDVEYHRETVTFVAQEGGETLAGVSGLPMRQNVRGVVLGMAGVASVTSSPLARRRGVVRALLGRLFEEMRGAHPVSVLYPFRPSFYEQFGFAGLPAARTVAFAPGGLGHLVRRELPGSVHWRPVAEGYDEQRAFALELLGRRHGFVAFAESRAVMLRDAPRWLVTARDGSGRTVGAAAYRIERQGGDLVADTFWTEGVLGRSLLLQFFARHVDQVGRVVLPLASAGEAPELWGTDLTVEVTQRVAHPTAVAPMARVLDPLGLDGMRAGEGRAVVELPEGRFELAGDGVLRVRRTDRSPDATLTTQGFSALVYGVLDVAEVEVRGFGAGSAELDRIFPRELPFISEAF
ncbi:GNAT family N-acetyltransferase [Spirilliplanes yamanashiensis]|uniref:N-acetyltransferase domain-containing protein n=1 Tax=Spirilliplanes yamanashiensis TaxID=42233 RepID=A0A8J4DH23_9ACTN|nr:GNAT family N-acetyltransferase [Spirilliplanes yamanashiensis]MDP9819424.1 putative N-acetyltransferase YhbS [Spirilliplanes yamanashiensis]GIJ01752.1 hypothetical protein Sya03_11040 [Spirilliplanes yamanashiensis]